MIYSGHQKFHKNMYERRNLSEKLYEESNTKLSSLD